MSSGFKYEMVDQNETGNQDVVINSLARRRALSVDCKKIQRVILNDKTKIESICKISRDYDNGDQKCSIQKLFDADDKSR